jgi:hypothetical protein
MRRWVVNVGSPPFLPEENESTNMRHGEEHDGLLGGTALR